jgi:hypothetical protein
VRPEALDALRMDRENVLARHFPLLEAATADETASVGDGAPAEAKSEAAE